MIGKIVQYAFQVGEPWYLASFYRDTLGMKVLRHEEFFEGCPGCNAAGHHSQAWSKTVFGYWPEHKSFSIEVHYSGNAGPPLKENQLVGFTIRSEEILRRAKALQEPIEKKRFKRALTDPDGRKFFVLKEKKIKNKEPVLKITLRSTSLKKTLDYWHCLLGLSIFSKKRRSVVLGYNDKGVKLKFILATQQVTRGKGYIKIAAPLSYIQQIEAEMKDNSQVIATPLTTLRVNKTVQFNFLMLSDPDAHLICFVDQSGFEAMAKCNERANMLLNDYVDLHLRMRELDELSELNFNEAIKANR